VHRQRISGWVDHDRLQLTRSLIAGSLFPQENTGVGNAGLSKGGTKKQSSRQMVKLGSSSKKIGSGNGGVKKRTIFGGFEKASIVLKETRNISYREPTPGGGGTMSAFRIRKIVGV